MSASSMLGSCCFCCVAAAVSVDVVAATAADSANVDDDDDEDDKDEDEDGNGLPPIANRQRTICSSCSTRGAGLPKKSVLCTNIVSSDSFASRNDRRPSRISLNEESDGCWSCSCGVVVMVVVVPLAVATRIDDDADDKTKEEDIEPAFN